MKIEVDIKYDLTVGGKTIVATGVIGERLFFGHGDTAEGAKALVIAQIKNYHALPSPETVDIEVKDETN